jgi:hypothetical protein
MRFAVALGLVACLQLAQAAPISHRDMFRAVDRMDAAFRRAQRMPAAKPRAAGADRLATRAEAVKELHRLFKAYRPRFRVTPRPFRSAEQAFLERVGPSGSPEARRLVRWGCLAPVGPLVTGPPDRMETGDFGRALGDFYCQMAWLVGRRSPKWTPDLQNPSDP